MNSEKMCWADVGGVRSAGLTGLFGDCLADLFQFGASINFLVSPGHWSEETMPRSL